MARLRCDDGGAPPAEAARIDRAIELAPGQLDYRLRDADICILEGRIAAATALLTALANVTTDRAAVEGAGRRLAALAQMRRE